MTKQTLNKVLRALDRLFKETMLALVPNPSAAKIAFAVRLWRSSPECRRLKKLIAKAPEPKPGQVENALAEMDEYLSRLGQAMKQGMNVMVRIMSKPRRGPKPAIPKDKWRDVCAQIGGLREAGKPVREAVISIAGLYKVNERTVYRIWRRRSELLKPSEGERQ